MREIGSNLKVVDIEDLNESFFRTPLMINFEDAPGNHVGTPQSACNGCGNCMSGCNTGAKNTVAMNYLPDAVQHGAEVFTQVELCFHVYQINFEPIGKWSGLALQLGLRTL